MSGEIMLSIRNNQNLGILGKERSQEVDIIRLEQHLG